jgi:acyl-CoA synthetase (AMP-forming)/AMP-acid ligase II
MIIRSGMKVFPVKVEHVLRMHQQVRDVAVVGRPDPHSTEVVVAVISPAPPADEESKLADELRALCREHLAPYEVPQVFEFIEQLPRSALGKLLKRELRKGQVTTTDTAVLPDPAGAIPREKSEGVNGYSEMGQRGDSIGRGPAPSPLAEVRQNS